MTKNLSITIIASVIIALTLGSCANKFSLVKRKYNKGYHFSVASGNKSSAKSNASSNTTPTKLEAFAESKPQATPVVEKVKKQSFTEFETLPMVKRAETEKVKNQRPNAVLASTKNLETEKVQFKEVSTKQYLHERAAMKTTKSSDSDLKLIILVILSIFIPPLAIYLKGESLNKWFWLTLIFCLLSFSVFIFSLGGLLWLASIIIALLYVFDMIS
jgi:uncharacterized membrane protein YqaE (UPF0057 family)